jgi:hypothetical protein
MKTPASRIIIAGLGIALLGCILLIAWGYWQIYGIGGWRDQVYGAKGALASSEALKDFRRGHLRLYQLAGETESSRYTGTNDGPFEVWIAQFYPSLGRAHRYATEQFIEFYNRKMRYMYAHPERFREHNDVQPDGAANRSQPVSSETNRASAAAGSGR